MKKGLFLACCLAGWCLECCCATALLHGGGQRHLSLASSNASARMHNGPAPAPAVAISNLPGKRQHVFRPNLNSQEPEIILFGILCRSISNIDLKHGTFFADVVITLKWKDPEAAKLCHAVGEKEVTLSKAAARSRMWLPDVTISNRASKGIETISTWVHVWDDGRVTKVERMLTTVSNQFGVHAFPFDSQTLKIQIGSASLMLDELQFQPIQDEELTGVSGGILEESDFSYTGFNVTSIEEKDALLKKSRGELDIRVSRRSMPYIQSLLLPELLVLAISFSVFWFPQTGPFVMPRVGTALISFLALTTLGLRTNTLLPVRSGLSWIDLFETCCMTLMFFTVGLNIFVLVMYHSLEAKALAGKIDNELKGAGPICAAVIFVVCFYFADGHGLGWLGLLVNNFLFLAILIYLGWCWLRLTTDEEYLNMEAEASAVAK